MGAVTKAIRRSIRFVLAALLWSHAMFLLNLDAGLSKGLTRLLHFTGSEIVVFSLLLVLSFLTSSGFWTTVGNLAYIYAFPFVLLFYVFYAVGLTLLAIGGWFRRQSPSETSELTIQNLGAVTLPSPNSGNENTNSSAPNNRTKSTERFKRAALILSRPVRRFTLLWCFLLLITTHQPLVWFSLAIVLAHLARTIFRVLQITLFSGVWFGKVEDVIRKSVETTLEKLAIVTDDSPATPELKGLWTSVNAFENGVRFLENQTLVSKWAWLFCGVFIGSVYLYLAFLFSFAYYGIARANSTVLSWPECLVTSLFIPFLIGDLPRVLALKLLGGIHCTLIVTVGAGTIFRYFRRRLESIRSVATIVSVQLADQTIRDKYSILKGKFGQAAPSTKS